MKKAKLKHSPIGLVALDARLDYPVSGVTDCLWIKDLQELQPGHREQSLRVQSAGCRSTEITNGFVNGH